MHVREVVEVERVQEVERKCGMEDAGHMSWNCGLKRFMDELGGKSTTERLAGGTLRGGVYIVSVVGERAR